MNNDDNNYASSLFTDVPLDYTINVILRRIYTEREIETNITKKELKRPTYSLYDKCTFFL